MSNTFKKGKIYKITNTIDDEIYVGSTVELLCQRMAKHRYDMKTKPHYKLYQHMAKYGVENFNIYLLEKYPCESKEELNAQEGEWIKKIATLNNKIAGRNQQQYYQDNREEQLQKMKEYRVECKEEVNRRQREHRNNNIEREREKDRQRYKENPDKRKAVARNWYKNNPEKAKETNRKWKENNPERKKEIDKAYRQMEVKCDVCNCNVKKCKWTVHVKTQKHIKNEEKQSVK